MSRTLRYSTKRAVPIECLRLCEDIQALEQAIKLLKGVDSYNTSKDSDKDELWFCTQKLQMLHQYALQKMRMEFLDPRKVER